MKPYLKTERLEEGKSTHFLNGPNYISVWDNLMQKVFSGGL